MKNNSFDVTSKHFNVTKTESGQRLDKFISDKLPEISRNQVQKFIDGQQISIPLIGRILILVTVK